MKKHTISLCMIVKNEEKHLEKCLSSVSGIVDEIIVVDTGSVDGTVEIAKKYNAIVKHFKWTDDFAAARNYSIADVRTEYILFLDADEYFDDSVNLQKDLEFNKDYYKLTVRNYQGTGLIVYHQNIRLFKSGIGLSFGGRLHERLNAYEDGTKYSGAYSDVVIHHTGYLPEVVSEKGKKRRNYDIMLKELQECPTGFSYYNMGIVHMNYEEYEKALDMFKKAFPLSKDKEFVKGMLVRTGECLDLLNRTEEGLKLILDAMKVFPGYTDLHFTAGKLYQDLGYLRDAELEFKECLKLGEKVENISTEGVGGYIAHYHLAMIYEKQGRTADAFEEAYAAITKKKSFTPALSLYVRLMQRSGIQHEEIKEHLDGVYKVTTIEELKALIYSLYDIRHPLLSKYEFTFGTGQSAEIRAVAMTLNREYDAALEEWRKVVAIAKPNILDAAVMCLISKDKPLLEKLKRSVNLSNREWKTISCILLKEAIEKPDMTAELEKFLLDMGEYLINIDEFDQFQYISTFLLQCSSDTREKLAALLLANGFTDTALELLDVIIEENPMSFMGNEMLGEVFLRGNKLREAMIYFYKSLEIKDDYSIYEKIYNIYDKIEDKKSMSELGVIMKNKFPLSIWLKRI